MKLTFDYRIYGRYRRRGRRLREIVAKRLKKALKGLKRAVRGHLKLKRNQRRLIFGFLVVAISLLLASLWLQHVGAQHQAQQSAHDKALLNQSLSQTRSDLLKLEATQTSTQKQLDEKKAAEEQYKAHIQDIEAQLQTRRTQSLLNKVASVVSPKVSAYGGSLGDWLYKLRRCESGGDYAINTGNGYYGAYQFTEATWNHWQTGYARADLAPPDVQDATIIKNTNASSGGLTTQNPGCYQKEGLSAYPPA